MVLKTGASLVRQWRGHTHTVLVGEDGFEYEGQRYRSLTVIGLVLVANILVAAAACPRLGL
jgi:hypothetical protein